MKQRTGTAISALMLILGASCWYQTGFNGLLFAPSDMSTGDGRIVAAIFIAAAANIFALTRA